MKLPWPFSNGLKSTERHTQTESIGARLSISEKAIKDLHLTLPYIQANSVDFLYYAESEAFGTMTRGHKAFINNSAVYVKVPCPEKWRSEDDMYVNLLKEIRTMKSIENDYVVKIYGWTMFKVLPGIIVESSIHGSLYNAFKACRESIEEEKLEVRSPLIEIMGMKKEGMKNWMTSWENRLNLCVKIAEAINFMHMTLGKVHGDISSKSILLCEQNGMLTPKLFTLGVNRTYAGQIRPLFVTKKDTLWTAPEIIKEDKCSNKIDVYSFGIILWEFLTWKEPYYNWGKNRSILIDYAIGSDIQIPLMIPNQYVLWCEAGGPCPFEGYVELTKRCVDIDVDKRPDFNEIIDTLKRLAEASSRLSNVPRNISMPAYTLEDKYNALRPKSRLTSASTKSNSSENVNVYMGKGGLSDKRHKRNNFTNFILEEMKRIVKCPNPINSCDPATNKQIVKPIKVCTVDSNHLKHKDIWNEFKTFFLKNYDKMKDEREKLWKNIFNFIQGKDSIDNHAECKFIEDFIYTISCTTNKSETDECMSRLRSIISTLTDIEVFTNFNIQIPRFDLKEIKDIFEYKIDLECLNSDLHRPEGDYFSEPKDLNTILSNNSMAIYHGNEVFVKEYRMVSIFNIIMGSEKLLNEICTKLNVIPSKRNGMLLLNRYHYPIVHSIILQRLDYVLSRLKNSNNVNRIIGYSLRPMTIVTEYSSVGSLRNFLRNRSRQMKNLFAEMRFFSCFHADSDRRERICNILIGIADGLLSLHESNIVHYNLTSSNILFSPTYEVKIDISTSSLVDPFIPFHEISYASPELLHENNPDAKSDVYSFGCLMWELMTGEVPFNDHTYEEIIQCVLSYKNPEYAYNIRKNNLQIFLEDIPEHMTQKCADFIPKEFFIHYVKLMRLCWLDKPSERYNFDNIIGILLNMKTKHCAYSSTALSDRMIRSMTSSNTVSLEEKFMKAIKNLEKDFNIRGAV